MESYQELKERLNRVILQKDRLQEQLANMVDRFWSGMANGLFDGGGFRTKENEKDEKCEGGKTLMEVKWGGCNKVKDGCCKGCHLEFDLYMLMEDVINSTAVLRELDESMIPFYPEEIPEFDRRFEYTVTTEWFCRKMLRLLNSFCVGTDNKQAGGNKAIGEAFVRLICFGLDTSGFREGVREFLDLKELEKKFKDEGKPQHDIVMEVKRRKEGFNNFWKMIEHASEVHEHYKDIVEEVKNRPDNAVKPIALLSLLLFMEFDFCHKYPGADNGVYKGAFQSIAFLCVSAMRLKENDRIGFIDFLNESDKDGSFTKNTREIVK